MGEFSKGDEVQVALKGKFVNSTGSANHCAIVNVTDAHGNRKVDLCVETKDITKVAPVKPAPGTLVRAGGWPYIVSDSDELTMILVGNGKPTPAAHKWSTLHEGYSDVKVIG